MVHMSLYNEWQKLCEKQRTEEENNEFWNTYLEKEMKVYEFILEHHDEVVEGKLAELAEKFDMEPVVFAGFMDGINTSLKNPVKLRSLVMIQTSGLKLILKSCITICWMQRRTGFIIFPVGQHIESGKKKRNIEGYKQDTHCGKQENWKK